MKKLNFWCFIIAFGLMFPIHGQKKGIKCGDWRWDVKTLTDKGGTAILKSKPVEVKFDQFLQSMSPRKLAKDNDKDRAQARFTSEKEVVEMTAYITSMTISQEDHDFMMVLKSPDSDATMMAELPNPECSSLSKFTLQQEQFKKTWSELSCLMDKISQNSKPIKVKITGVRFWDAVPGQRGASENGIEIHPVIKVTVLPY
jgi:hypothetical protein